MKPDKVCLIPHSSKCDCKPFEFNDSTLDPAEQHVIMKENHNEAILNSESFGRHADPLNFGNKEIYQLNDSNGDISSLSFEVKSKEYWNPFVDGFPMDIENGLRDSHIEDTKSEVSYTVSEPDKDTFPFPSDSNNGDELPENPDHEEFSHFEDSESLNPDSDFIASNLCEKNEKLFADKNVLEQEIPELTVCYKEVNYHIVKDICIDEGMPVEEKGLDKALKKDHSHSESPNDSAGGVDIEFFAPESMAPLLSSNQSSLAYTTEYVDKEESHGKKISQGRPRTLSESSSNDDTDDHGDLANSEQQMVETKLSTTGMSDPSEKLSFVESTLPIQEFGTRSFLRSFINSLDGEGSKVVQKPVQISSEKRHLGGPAGSSTETGLNEDVQARSLRYNSMVESGSITFNFKSPSPVERGIRTENVKEQHVPGDMDEPKNPNFGDHVGPIHVQRTTVENVPDNSIKIMEASNDDSETNRKNPGQENSPEQYSDLKNDEHSVYEQVLYVSSKIESAKNNEVQVIEPNEPKHERKDSGGVLSANHFPAGSVSVANNLQRDEGETSFSALGLITYSGPIAYSGSLSIRSDGSATSTRSFAFPILQNEGNSSPVRMAKADRKNFRKHKGWRSGLFCCRF